MTEQEYRDLPSHKYYSYSLLSSVDINGPSALKEKEDTGSKRGISWGSITHVLMFAEDEFDKKYKVLKYFDVLTATFGKLKDALLERYKNGSLELDDIARLSDAYIDHCDQIREDQELWKNLSNREKIIEKYKDDLLWNCLLEEIDNIDDEREFITTEDFMNITLVVKLLKSHPFTKQYFKKNKPKDVQILYEMPILYQLDKKDFKSMLDIIFINHKEKTIRVLDLKTGAELYGSFWKSFFKWRYDIQAVLYTYALESFLDRQGLKDYRILEPLYIYISRKDLERPYVFRISETTLMGALKGYTSKFGKRVKGVFDLIKDIEFYRKNDVYDYDRDIYENDGIIDIDTDLIITKFHNSSIHHSTYMPRLNNNLAQVPIEDAEPDRNPNTIHRVAFNGRRTRRTVDELNRDRMTEHMEQLLQAEAERARNNATMRPNIRFDGDVQFFNTPNDFTTED